MAGTDSKSPEVSPYEKIVRDAFGPDLDPQFDAPLVPVGICLCFVNRSGSNYLASCLASSGAIPRAREFFLRRNLLEVAARDARSGRTGLSAVFESIVTRHRDHGIFAAKFGYAQFALFEALGYFEAAFESTRILYLQRRDTLAQAISLELASQSQRWKASRDEGAETKPPEYSRKRIELKRAGIQAKYRRFEALFQRADRSALTLVYEDLVDDPAATAASAGEALGIPLSISPELASSKGSSNPLKDEWKQRFLKEE